MFQDNQNLAPPKRLADIEHETKALGFAMASEPQTGSMLRMLAASKTGGRFLELGTGTGLSTCWILDGMDQDSTLVTVEQDESVLAVARKFLADDVRVAIHLSEGAAFVDSLEGQMFDFIFADTWPGKFHHLDETLALLAAGGFYVIDDLLPQDSWPEGHAPKVPELVETLESRADLVLTKMRWASGLVVVVKQ